MADYQLTATDAAVLRTTDTTWIPNAADNTDWQRYQQWLADGGVPDPYVPPAPAVVAEVSTLGFKLAMEEIGRWPDAAATIESLGVEDDFIVALLVRRADVEDLGAAMVPPLTPAEVDTIMTRGNALASTPMVTPPSAPVSLFKRR